MKLPLLALIIGCNVCLAVRLSAEDKLDPGFVPLFNGRDLSGWNGAAGYWTVEDGAITGETTSDRRLSDHSYLIWTGGHIGDFELRVSFRCVSGNSGIQYRSRKLEGYLVAGYQCNIQTAKPGHTGILEEMKNGRGGALAKIGERVMFDRTGNRRVTAEICDPDKVESVLDRSGWNRLTIIAQGNRLVHKLNGLAVIDVRDLDANKSSASGIIALQLHAGKPMKVQFRDLFLKRL